MCVSIVYDLAYSVLFKLITAQYKNRQFGKNNLWDVHFELKSTRNKKTIAIQCYIKGGVCNSGEIQHHDKYNDIERTMTKHVI